MKQKAEFTANYWRRLNGKEMMQLYHAAVNQSSLCASLSKLESLWVNQCSYIKYVCALFSHHPISTKSKSTFGGQNNKLRGRRCLVRRPILRWHPASFLAMAGLVAPAAAPAEVEPCVAAELGAVAAAAGRPFAAAAAITACHCTVSNAAAAATNYE